MPLDFGATLLSTYVAHLLIQASKDSVRGIWIYRRNLIRLQATLDKGLQKLEETIIRINKMNPIQSGIHFDSAWLNEIEEFWYKMLDREDDPKSHLEFITGSLTKCVAEIEAMQGVLDSRETSMNRELAENQGQSSGSRSARQQELPTHPNLWAEKKETIIRELIGAGSLGVTIVGICGSGKTLLAREVAKDESIKAHFPCIIDPLQDPFPEFSCASVTEPINEKLPDSETRKSTRILILLDGLQKVDSTEWVFFRGFCKAELHSESKVLVTTQNPQIADATGTYKHLLGDLSDGKCFTMILDIARTNRNLSDLDVIAIKGRKAELVKKCMGLPLLAHRIGALLAAAGPGKRGTTAQEIINKDLWKWEKFESVLGKLTLVSLLQKKQFFKWCLNYCSLFPPDTEFNKDLLLQLWIAEGLIAHSKEEENFECLLSHSIFKSSDNNPHYEMHPLAYDFAQNVKYGAFYREDIGESSHSTSTGITDITRHFSLSCKDSTGNGQKDAVKGVLAVIKRNCKNLRTFLLVQPAGRLITENTAFFQKLTRLRVLDLSHTALKDRSLENISELEYLRYLDLSSTAISTVPSLYKNLKLQVLKLNDCENLRTLPKHLPDLSDLLYFQLKNVVNKLIEMPPRMGKLTNLRGLEVFLVGNTEKGVGQGIEQLNGMNKLTEPLEIARLENVKSKQEAQKAALQQKDKLKTLKLHWSADYSKHAEATQVLEGLEPPQTLSKLTITNYSGSEFPEWLSKCWGLNTIELENCQACSNLPPLGDLTQLNHIQLTKMEELATLPALPSSLKSLTIEKCSNVVVKIDDLREIKDLVVKIDGDRVLPESSSTQNIESGGQHHLMDASPSSSQEQQNIESGGQHHLMDAGPSSSQEQQDQGRQAATEDEDDVHNSAVQSTDSTNAINGDISQEHIKRQKGRFAGCFGCFSKR